MRSYKSLVRKWLQLASFTLLFRRYHVLFLPILQNVIKKLWKGREAGLSVSGHHQWDNAWEHCVMRRTKSDKRNTSLQNDWGLQRKKKVEKMSLICSYGTVGECLEMLLTVPLLSYFLSWFRGSDWRKRVWKVMLLCEKETFPHNFIPPFCILLEHIWWLS